MDISSPGQVSSLAPDVTRPNAPAQPQAAAAAPVGGASQNAPAKVVADSSGDAGVGDDAPHSAPKDDSAGVDITV